MKEMLKRLHRKLFDKQTKLQHAIRSKDVARVRELIENGADPGVKTEHTEWPIVEAALKGNKEIVAILIDREVDLNVESDWGHNPLYLSIDYEENVIAKLLIDAGARVHPTSCGDHPLVKAALYESVELVEIILQLGADINFRDSNGSTALMCATLKENAKIVQILLDQGADMYIENKVQYSAPMLETSKSVVKLFRDSAKKRGDTKLEEEFKRVNQQKQKEADLEKEERRIIETLEAYMSKYSSPLTLVIEEDKRKKESRIREIGRRLHNRGGLSEMRRVFEEIDGQPGSRLIEMVWSGIGDWRG